MVDKISKISVNNWNHTASILTHIDSVCSNIHFPPLVKQYCRPQLQRSEHVDDSFLISSLDSSREFQHPQFAKLNDSIDFDAVPHAFENPAKLRRVPRNRVSVANSSKHSSITFASIFKNHSATTLSQVTEVSQADQISNQMSKSSSSKNNIRQFVEQNQRCVRLW